MDRAEKKVQEQGRIARELLVYDYQAHGEPRIRFREKLQAYIKDNPGTILWSASQARLGDVFRDEQRIVPAKEAYMAAYNHKQGLPFARGWAALQLGYISLSEAQYEAAKELLLFSEHRLSENYFYHVQNGLGVAYYCLRDMDNARACWQRIIETADKAIKALPKKEVNVERKRAFLNKFLGRACLNSSVLLETSGEYERAAEYLTTSQRLSPSLTPEQYNERLLHLRASATKATPSSEKEQLAF